MATTKQSKETKDRISLLNTQLKQLEEGNHYNPTVKEKRIKEIEKELKELEKSE